MHLLLDYQLVGLLGSEVGLIVLLVNELLDLFLLLVVLNLASQINQVVEVVLSAHFQVLQRKNVLLFLLPIEFLPLKFSDLLYLFAFFLKSLLRLVVDCLQVLHKILSFVDRMVVHSEWPLRPQESRVSIAVVLLRNCFAVQRHANEVLNL